MSWTADTDSLLAQNGKTVTVKNNAVTHTEYSVLPVNTETIIETSTVLIFPKSGGFKKLVKGEVKESTHLMFFPDTSSVAVDNRIYESGDSSYHEVMDVRDYDGHKQVYTRRVEGR